MGKSQFGLALMTLVALSAARGASAGDFIKAPCSDAPASGLRPCSDVVEGFVIKKATESIGAYVEDYLYENVDRDPTDPTKVIPWGKTLCSLSDNRFKRGATEIATNHKGKSCGDGVKLSIKRSGLSAEIKVDQRVEDLELGYLRGTFTQAIGCFEKQLYSELRNTGGITIKTPACKSIGLDIANYGTQMRDVTNGLASSLTGQENIADIMNCKTEVVPGAGTGAKVDPGSRRQSAQQLCAARAGLEAAFAHLLVCEVSARSTTGYLNKVGYKAAQITDGIVNLTKDRCKSECEGNQPPRRNQNQTPYTDDELDNAAGAGVSCIQRCYQRTMRGYIRDLGDTNWASTGQGCVIE